MNVLPDPLQSKANHREGRQLRRALAAVPTPDLAARLGRTNLWRFHHVRTARSSDFSEPPVEELHRAPYSGDLLVFTGGARQDADSLFSRRVIQAFQAIEASDSPRFREGVLAFALSYGSLRATSADVLAREYFEPIDLWADLVDYIRDLGAHMRMAQLYIESHGDHEHARRYFQQRVEAGHFANAPTWWVLPAGRFVLNKLPYPDDLDAFIHHVPSILAESLNYYTGTYGHHGFRVNIDASRNELRYEATCLEAALVLQVIRDLFLPRRGGLDRVCTECREPFVAGRKDQRYCSLRCRVAHHRNMKGVARRGPVRRG